jgi:hypothetical protein
MWPFRKKAVPTQCVCHIFDPRYEGPITQLRDIGDGRGQVPRETYERFNDDGEMFLVFMVSKDKSTEMDGWFVPKATAKAVTYPWFDKSDLTPRYLKLAASPLPEQAEIDRVVDDFMKTWIFYNEKLTFKPDVSLGEIIAGFSIPMRNRWANEHPSLTGWGDCLFWRVIGDAIVREGRFKRDEINTAVAEAQAAEPRLT